MIRLFFLLSSLCYLVGCSGLQLRVEVERDGKAMILRSGEGLATGDRFTLQLSVPNDSYVYVARTIPDGGTQNLYPLQQLVKVRAGSVQRIPTDGTSITLDTLQSDARLCVVLSPEPIKGSLPRCQAEGSPTATGRDSDTKGTHGGIGGRPGTDGVRVLSLPVAPCVPPPGTGSPGHRALLIGIDHYLRGPDGRERAGDLAGALNDVEAIRTVLRARYGFTDREMCILRDGQATRAGIVAAIRSFLIQPTRAGDQTFFYYAGHGSTAPNALSLEPDKTDETIVPADANREVADLRDKELLRLFNQILDRGGKLIAVFDSCHSGSITMAANGPAQGSAAQSDVRTRSAEPATIFSRALPLLGQPPQARGAVIIMATQSHEKAQERLIGDTQRGIFTAAFVRALLAESASQSVENLVQSVQGYMREWGQGNSQVPGLDTRLEQRQQPLFGGSARAGIYVAASRLTGQGVLLDAGGGLGLGKGAELERTTAPALVLHVEEVIDIASSLAKVSSVRNEKDVSPQDLATLRVGDLFRVVKFGASEQNALQLFIGEAGPGRRNLDATAQALAPLRSHKTIRWVDPSQSARQRDSHSHVMRYRSGSWELAELREHKLRPLGNDVTAAALLALLPPDARLLVEWPLDATQHRDLKDELGRLGTTVMERDNGQADYVLRGTLLDTPKYALQQGGSKPRVAMPHETAWSAYEALHAGALALVRQHRWLTLKNGPDADTGFPYRMQLVNLQTQQPLASGGQTSDEERYFLRLELPPGTPPQSVEQRYVYLCALSNHGDMLLLYPRTGANQQNYLPPEPLLVPSIDLKDESKFKTKGEPSIDTYVLLTSERPLSSPAQLCSTQQHMSTCDDSRDSELCKLLQGLNLPTETGKLPQAARWSVQRLEVRHRM